ncbi:hypothetical protein INT45_009567 [Circinella minor]|uniref:DDE-1 domain-containing protein n=1 Tax=Circinella minor TaxID=1195481 RepID=A0A8H7RSV3_9FUNG|nr:hypothetical protein INT45_009567 [Circinella minor]
MTASQIAAKTAWIVPSNHYRARAIRSYAQEYLHYGKISLHQQGKHVKRASLLSNEDVKEAARKWIISTKLEKRDIPELLKYLNHTIIPTVYYDGHERADVVQYRKEWASKMVEYNYFMEKYNEDDVTMDESTFYCNESPINLWLLENENPIRNKSPSGSIMVSEFQCPCHGTMRIKNWKSRKFFFAGTNRDGYWTWKDMHQQIKDDVIPLFEKLHPGCQALFILDQSSNHNAYAPSAKRATCFNLKDTQLSSVNQRVILPGYYIGPDGEKKIQNFYNLEIKNEGKKNEQRTWFRKGLETILTERGLGKWDEFKAEGKYWKAKCGNKEANSDHTCCPFHMLENQPDFLAQKQHWRNLLIARRECDYSFKSLQENLDGFLDQVSPPDATPIEIQRYYNHCWRYIYAYNDMKDRNEAFKLVEKFTSKRFLSHHKPGVHD